jgi:hypothetical protein
MSEPEAAEPGARSSFWEHQFNLIDAAAFDPVDAHTGWCTHRVVQRSDVHSGISAVHLPKVLSAFETLAEVAGAREPANANRFEIVLWCGEGGSAGSKIMFS